MNIKDLEELELTPEEICNVVTRYQISKGDNYAYLRHERINL